MTNSRAIAHKSWAKINEQKATSNEQKVQPRLGDLQEETKLAYEAQKYKCMYYKACKLDLHETQKQQDEILNSPRVLISLSKTSDENTENSSIR